MPTFTISKKFKHPYILDSQSISQSVEPLFLSDKRYIKIGNLHLIVNLCDNQYLSLDAAYSSFFKKGEPVLYPFKMTVHYTKRGIADYARVEIYPLRLPEATMIEAAKLLYDILGIRKFVIYDYNRIECDKRRYYRSHHYVYTHGVSYYEQFGFKNERHKLQTQYLNKLQKIKTTDVLEQLKRFHDEPGITKTKLYKKSISSWIRWIEFINTPPVLFKDLVATLSCRGFATYEKWLTALVRIPSMKKYKDLSTLYELYKLSYGIQGFKGGEKDDTDYSEKTIVFKNKTYHIDYYSDYIYITSDHLIMDIKRDEDEIFVYSFEVEYTIDLIKYVFKEIGFAMPSIIHLQVPEAALLYDNVNNEYVIKDVHEYSSRDVATTQVVAAINYLRSMDIVAYLKKIKEWAIKAEEWGEIQYKLRGEIETIILSDKYNETTKEEYLKTIDKYLSYKLMPVFRRYQLVSFLIKSKVNLWIFDGKRHFDEEFTRAVSTIYNNIDYISIKLNGY
jgi:hypothetical protein